MTIIRSLALGKNNLEHRIQTEACHLVDIFANTKGNFTEFFLKYSGVGEQQFHNTFLQAI